MHRNVHSLSQMGTDSLVGELETAQAIDTRPRRSGQISHQLTPARIEGATRIVPALDITVLYNRDS